MDLLPQFNPDDYPDSPGYKPLLKMNTPSKVSKCETTEVSRLPSAIIYMTYDTVLTVEPPIKSVKLSITCFGQDKKLNLVDLDFLLELLDPINYKDAYFLFS
jgi:hypothetical protein